MTSLSERVETAVTKIEDSSDIAEQFADISNTTEFTTPNGQVKPIGLLQQEAEAAIQSMAAFNEETFVASTVYDGTQKVYFVDSGVAYTPVNYPYATGASVSADVTAGTLMVLQGLTLGDTGTGHDQVPKNSDLESVLPSVSISQSGGSFPRTLSDWLKIQELSFDSLSTVKVLGGLEEGQRVSVASEKSKDECDLLEIPYPDGKACTYIVVPQGSGGTSTGEFVDVVGKQLKRNLMISKKLPNQAAVVFMFDDGWDSLLSLADAFEARRVFFGLPVNNNLDSTNKITTAQALDLENRGFEFILHGATHLDMRDSSSVTFSQALAEISNNESYLRDKGLNPKGFVCPSSSIKREFMPIVRKYADFSYPVFQSLTTQTTEPPISLHSQSRVNITGNSLADIKNLIDESIVEGSLVTLYDHDPSKTYNPNSATEAEILDVLDYVLNKGVRVILPSEVPQLFDIIDADQEVSIPMAEGTVIPNEVFVHSGIGHDIDTDIVFADSTTGEILIKKTGLYNIVVNLKPNAASTDGGTRIVIGLEIDGTGTIRYRSEGVVVDQSNSSDSNTSASLIQTLSFAKGQKLKVMLYSSPSVTITDTNAYSRIYISKAPHGIKPAS